MADPDLRQLQGCVGANLRRATRAVNHIYDEAMRSCGLRGTQFTLLANLAGLGPSTMGALAAAIGLDRTTLTRNLQALERAGLIAEVPDEDQRKRRLQITEAGRAALYAAIPLWQEAQGRVLAALGQAQAASLLATLDLLVDEAR